MIAREQRGFVQAEQWYRKFLAISEKQGNEHGAAMIYHQLGIIAEDQRDFVQAGQCYIRSVVTFAPLNNRHNLQIAVNSFWRCYSQAPPTDQDKLKAFWERAGLGPFPDIKAGE